MHRRDGERHDRKDGGQGGSHAHRRFEGRNGKLKRENTALRGKLRQALNPSGSSTGRRRPATAGSKRAPVGDANLDSMLRSFATAPADTAHAQQTRQLVSALRGRLVNTEKRLQALTRENSKLRRGKSGMSASISSPRHSASGMNSIVSGDVAEMQRELRDKTAQITLLQSR